MTENESILSILQNGIVCAIADITREDLEMMVKCLEELQQYRAIGTVEEIKSYFEENRKAGYKHGYLDGCEKAIDEFTELINQKSENDWIIDLKDEEEYQNFIEEIEEIAEELKEGAE